MTKEKVEKKLTEIRKQLEDSYGEINDILAETEKLSQNYLNISENLIAEKGKLMSLQRRLRMHNKTVELAKRDIDFYLSKLAEDKNRKE